jgi:oligopeptide transport system permease protein
VKSFLKRGAWLPVLLFWACVVWTFLGYDLPPALLGAFLVTALLYFSFYVVENSLGWFVLRRTLEALFTIFVIASLTFLLLRTIPGGPFDEEKALPPEVKANIEAKYGLDQPLLTQYVIYMGNLAHGDLGESYKYVGRPITEIIADAFPTSIQLGVYALLVAYLLGLPLGVIAASRHGTWMDSALMMAAISGVSLPSFLVAPLFVILFSFTLGWFEPALWEGPSFYVLPMVVLGIRPAAGIARLTRASVLEVIRSDFIRTAKSKGLSERVVLFKHVFRNSLIPVLSLAGPMVAGILTGSFIIELIFAIPGLAKHMIQSVTNRDYPLVLGATLLFSVMLVVANLITDLLIAMIDPRVKFS